MSCKLTPVCCRAELEMQKTDKERIRRERDYLREISEGMRAEIAALKKAQRQWEESGIYIRDEHYKSLARARKAEAERDAAIAALEEIEESGESYNLDVRRVAREALAKLKGGG